MPNIYWTRNATAAIGPSGQTDFDDARESAESTSSTTQSTSTNAQVSGYIKSSARGGATFGFKRSYWGFDFTGYTAGDITNLKFNFKPTTSSTGTLGQRFVQFEGFGAEVGSNYSDDEWWDGIETCCAILVIGYVYGAPTLCGAACYKLRSARSFGG